MSYLRSNILRRLLALCFAVTSMTVQAQTLFACDLMDTPAATECCCSEAMNTGCKMGGGCDHPADGPASGCCTVMPDIDISIPDATLSSITHIPEVDLLSSSDPPPPLLPSQGITTAFSFLPDRTDYGDSLSRSWHKANNTYLITRRLRI